MAWHDRENFRETDQEVKKLVRRLGGPGNDTASLAHMSFAYQGFTRAIDGRSDLKYSLRAKGKGRGAHLILEAKNCTRALVRFVPSGGGISTSMITDDLKDQLTKVSMDAGIDRILVITDEEVPSSLLIEGRHPEILSVSVRDDGDLWSLRLSLDKVLGI